MARGDITIKYELRPCKVKQDDGSERKALFHKWGEPLGIVEFEDGAISQVEPERIRFIDGRFIEYMFPDSWEKEYDAE